jgi:hypothetical protein
MALFGNVKYTESNVLPTKAHEASQTKHVCLKNFTNAYKSATLLYAGWHIISKCYNALTTGS